MKLPLMFSVLLTAALFPLYAGLAGPVREPAVAGAFYPADSTQLAGMVDEMLLHSRPASPRARPLALVEPHAGYVYSGLVAAAGYRQLKGYRYSTVVVIAPSHREYISFSSVWCRGAYRTPLGTVPVDSTLADALVKAGEGKLRCSNRGHLGSSGGMGEHALEVQLPFLQRTLGRFKLVPVIMGGQTPDDCRALGEALAEVLRRRDDVLLVASSDLSHFHDSGSARRLDNRVAELVRNRDAGSLLSALQDGSAEACGGGPIAAVMIAAGRLGADGSTVMDQADSGDATGEKDRVVGYLSAMFFKNSEIEPTETDTSDSGETMGLTDQEKQYLLSLARNSIVCAVEGRKLPDGETPPTPVMAEKRGAFVTIKKHGELRGCIGYIVAVKPLYRTVGEMAVAAATRDPRFSPVQPDELDELDLEISVLSPISKVGDPAAIVVGRDGLIIRRGSYQGLLLPQVPTEYGWDRETFLAQTCRKAGLPSDAWKDPQTEIESFSAEVFGEKDQPGKK